MMTKQEFAELTKGEKAVLLLKSGEKQTSRSVAGFDIDLYYFDGLFAELFYQRDSDKIVDVQSIENVEILNNYADSFDLHQITNLKTENNL